MKRICALLAGACVLAVGAGFASAGEATKSKNVHPIARVAYKGGSHLDFGGGFAYGGELNGESGRDEPGFEKKGGIRIFDITGKPRQVGFFSCPGNDMDVAFIKRGLIAVGHHRAACTKEGGEGLFTLDVSNPAKPKLLGQVAFPYPMQRNHAIAAYPGKPLVYAAGGGLGRGQETVSIVDVSNPKKVKIAGTFFAPPRGCHDISFHVDKRGKFAICSGLGEVQIWNVNDPLKPQVVTRIHEPLTQFAHYAVASKDGKILVVNDEAIIGNECSEANVPAGALWIYDISDIENPRRLSYFSPPRGRTGIPIGNFWTETGTCTSHDFNFVDNRTVVVPWYTGGFNVVSLKDPTNPKEIAFYQPKDTNMWSAYWYERRIYTSDMGRGFEVLTLDGFSK